MTFWDKLKPVAVLSWADSVERDTLFEKESLTMKEFATCVSDLVNRCSLNPDSDSTAFHFQIEDMYIDIMARSSLTLAISHKKYNTSRFSRPVKPNRNAAPSKTLSSVNTGPNPNLLKVEKSVLKPVANTSPVESPGNNGVFDGSVSTAPLESKPEHDSTWKTIQGTRPQDKLHFYTFRDQASGPDAFLDFAGHLVGLPTLVKQARKHLWFHAYCPKTNILYDFDSPKHKGTYRKRQASPQYQKQFQKWTKNMHQQEMEQANDDQKYELHSCSYPRRDPHKRVIVGFLPVRRAAKRLNVPWCYAILDTDLTKKIIKFRNVQNTFTTLRE